MKHLSVSLQNPRGNSAHHIVKCYSRRSRAYTWQYIHWTCSVSLHAKASKFSVPHSPPTLISYNSLCRKHQYKLLYSFHITVEQGTVASLALPIFQLLAYCSHTNVAWVCTSALIIHLSCCPGGRHTIWATWRPLWHEHVAFILPCLYFQLPILCIAFWQLLGWETENYFSLYLDAGAVPCGNCNHDLWPTNMQSLTTR